MKYTLEEQLGGAIGGYIMNGSKDMDECIEDIKEIFRDYGVWQDAVTMPKDGRKIVRWHKIYKCELTVLYRENKETPWVDATYSNTWPEDAFSPYWRDVTIPPKIYNEILKGDLVLMPKCATKEMIDAWRQGQSQGESLESSYGRMVREYTFRP